MTGDDRAMTNDISDFDDDDLSRRTFLKVLSASLALAGTDGCSRLPAEKILPFVSQPPESTPGIAVHYATSMVLGGYATGLVVETHVGRPTKIEGNRDHPASLGAAGVFEQGSLLQLYDPDRAKQLRSGTEPMHWEAFAAALAPGTLRRRVGERGDGLAILLEPTSSPLVAELLARLRTLYPAMRVAYYSPLQALSLANAPSPAVVPQYDVGMANVLLAVDSDFLANGAFCLRYARQFADRRRTPLTGMNRLYVVEPGFTVTGGSADHRLRCRPTEIESLLARLLTMLAPANGASANATSTEGTHVGEAPTAGNSAESAELPTGVPLPWLAAVADDLRRNAGKSLVIGGERLSPAARARVDAINDTLGNTGTTVWYTPSPLLGAGDPSASLASLAGAMHEGAVDTLLCLGGNPSYATPPSLQFSRLLRAVPNSVYLGLYENETARDARSFVPAAHYLESWGDARAYDGTLSVIQPMVQPLYGGKSVVEMLAVLAGDPRPDPLALLRASWQRSGIVRDDATWGAALRTGFVPGTASARIASARPSQGGGGSPVPAISQRASYGDPSLVDVMLESDARVYDGSFSNNGWLQELPDPVTKLTWDNAALISPSTAARLDVASGDVIELRTQGTELKIPALIVPGMADDTVSLQLGYGRMGDERVADGIGVNVYAFWPALGSAVIRNATIRRDPSRAHHEFAITQMHWTMEGRDPARSKTLEEYQQTSDAGLPRRHPSPTIYPPVERLTDPHQWAMTIDLGTCIGCSACVIACQAENNIPVVGRADVARSREMHWLRIDRYQSGDPSDPEVVTQPMLCQQCEKAPCEYVCPVSATDHSPDGLNEMVYNRCVGTRFCSNNCPYKVRRFNWFDYNARLSETEQMGKNPDVTVRQRGVMEKCTFCVQRIREAEIAAERDGRPLRGDQIKTACQQSCPTNAIVFGSLTEPDSEMMQRRDEPRGYDVLEELGTQPRIRYLARIRNHNPALARDT